MHREGIAVFPKGAHWGASRAGLGDRQKVRKAITMALKETITKALGAGYILLLGACGYSQQEWDQKLRESEALMTDLKAQREAHAACSAEQEAAKAELGRLQAEFEKRGVNMETLSQDLERYKQASEEYRTRTQQLEQVRARFETLKGKLAELTKLGLEVQVRDNRMLIQLPGGVLFDSGRDKLKESGVEILRQVAAVLRADEDLARREFQVAGHTDSRPLSSRAFKDNWDLSAMRARSVVLFLTAPVEKEGGGLDPSHWSAAGYADTDPVASNETGEGREKNRRVELVVMPDVEEMLNLNSLAAN